MKPQMKATSLAKNQIQEGIQVRNENGRRPAAEEEGDAEAADGEHFEIFGEEEEGEFEAGIFDEVAGDDFGFAFGEIEGAAVGLRRRGDHEEDEAGESPGSEDVPVGQSPGVVGLLIDDRTGESEPAVMMTAMEERISGTS